ncbi:TIR domain-containing protein [Parasphingorhabdus sp. NYA22]
MRFRAFVSYSHADATIAQKLHRKIETYRLPQHLRDRQTDDPDNGRLGRIFRDREDLPAAEDLSESVKQALSGSQVLVVICSPDAQASIWVAREIELFRALHPGRPVLAALVRGEPEEAFPTALRYGTEPLAADLRKEGDGWRLGFLKIVAGIAGVPLDALVQRDATRRIRRVMAVTGGALVALLAMIGMTIFALQSRNEAQHQQAEAEGLVEYMLTDLRTELKGVGRLDVMTKVNERAMDYYEDQGDLSDMPAESLERRARILHAMGEDDEKRGDLDNALAKFTEAHRVTEALLARDPENPDFLFAEIQSLLYLAFHHRNAQHDNLAVNLNRKAKVLSHSLERVKPDEKYLRQAATIYGNLCAITVSLGILNSDSETDCTTALSLMSKAAERVPNDSQYLSELANKRAWYGDFLIQQNREVEGMKQLDEHLSIIDRLMKSHPENWQWLEQAVRSRMGYAELLRKAGNHKRAITFARMAVSLGEELVLHDPGNASWRGLLDRAKQQL